MSVPYHKARRERIEEAIDDEHPQMLAALNSIVVEFLFLPRSPALLNILLECSGSPSGTI
jgi:hypothetical protein